MATKKNISVDEKFPLIIKVTKSFPLRRIKEVYISKPESTYGDTIKINRDEASYLYDALKDILGEPEVIPNE